MQLRGKSLLSRPYIRILLALRERPRRFNDLKQTTGLNPSTVNRILKAFVREQFVWARMLPAEGERVPAEFRITPRGDAVLHVHEARVREAEKHTRVLGRELVAELSAEA